MHSVLQLSKIILDFCFKSATAKKKKNGSSVFKTVFRVFNMQFGFECTVDSQGNINLVGGAVLVVVDLRY